jgi:hypothetical protein
MTDWIEHDGGPQPVADDVWVEVVEIVEHAEFYYQCESQYANWPHVRHIHVLNQHLIDAARLEGIRLGLKAAARDVWHTGWHSRPSLAETAEGIRLLDPATIAREAVLDKLAGEAQEQGMGYDRNVRYGVEVVRPPSAPLIAKEADQ